MAAVLETQKEGRGPTPEGERREVLGQWIKSDFGPSEASGNVGYYSVVRTKVTMAIFFFLASPEEIHCQIVEDRAK